MVMTTATATGFRLTAIVQTGRGRFRIRAKSGHRAAGCLARTRFVISPTMLRLARRPISLWIWRMLRSVDVASDTTTSGGKLVFHLFAALAEFERGVIRERTLAGLQAARARGRTGGRPPALKAKDLAAAKAMLKDPEITVAEIARRLSVAPSTLYRHLPRARTVALET